MSLAQQFARQPRFVSEKYLEVSVLVDGVPLPVFRRYDGVPFVPAEIGKVFTLRVRNKHHGRVLVLSSVDGRNTQKKEEASFRMGGIIWPAGATDLISGWRLNDDQTAEFVFQLPEESVAARTVKEGRPLSIGSIGFAVFLERTPIYEQYSQIREPRRSKAFGDEIFQGLDLDTERSEPARQFGVGTGIGKVQLDAISRATFSRASDQPIEVIRMQYRELDWLVANGIVRDPDPDPFPGEVLGDTGYGDLLK